jgi:hypothetical protein
VNRRRLTLLFVMYVALDLSSPFVPGAFNFNPDESVEAVSRRRDASARRLPPGTTPPPSPRDETCRVVQSRPAGPALTTRPRAVSDWLIDVRRAHAPVPQVSTLSEDH